MIVGEQRLPFFVSTPPLPLPSKGRGVNPQLAFVGYKRTNDRSMKWLTLERIKQQLRIEPDFTDEDELLEEYGESAEEVLLNYLNRSYEDVIEVYGRVPAPLRHASLMLVDTSYQYRCPVSAQNMSLVPYTFDLLIKPYMRLASTTYEQNNNQYGCKKL